MCRGNFPVTIIPIYTAGQFRCVLDHFNNLRIVSGNTCNLVTAHKPAPISFTLAPKCNSLILRCFCSRNLRPQSIPFPFSELEQKIRDDLCSHGVCPAVSSILANWREQESKKWMFFDLKVQSDQKVDDNLYVNLSLCFCFYIYLSP